MIYKREEFEELVDNPAEDERFPVRHVEMMTPTDGSAPTFVGQVTLGLQTPMGVQQIPISFEIDAATVEEAFAKFEKAAEPKIEESRQTIEEQLRRMRDEASSRIVRPGEAGMGGLGGPGLGGAPGGGGGGLIDFDKLKGG